jgi:para-aminobenzoate synthetase component I
LDLKSTLNSFGKQKKPFFFIVSYDLKSYEIAHLENLSKDISYTIDDQNRTKKKLHFVPKYTSLKTYKKKFNTTINQIKEGNTYLLNLTTKTKIFTKHSLMEIYKNASAKYKLYYKNKFVSFSPETFIKIDKNKIYTFPMKGTINSNTTDAEATILNNKKELAEHTMIVDLLRNDLNIVSKNVKVDNFRYIDKIDAGDNKLLQVSSVISGELSENWIDNIGDIIVNLLPAGSITGTPKKSTVDIIKQIESYKRGYFTGVWGIYDGEKLDSAVLIRYLENTKNGDNLVYKSGGGITLDSILQDEYNEMIEKVYI